jgi:hypothetical protein
MIKRTLFLAIIVFAMAKTKAQQINYNLPKLPQWGVEKFNFPIDFAKNIPFIGVEELRFAPGWSDNKTGEYWAYTFLWFIEGKPILGKDKVNTYLRTYYDGLYISNIKDKKLTPPKNFTVADVKNVPPLANDQETYEGKIMTLDFLTGEPITLNIRMHVRNLPQIGHSALLIEVSPESYKQPVWVEMNNIVAGFRVTENGEN